MPPKLTSTGFYRGALFCIAILYAQWVLAGEPVAKNPTRVIPILVGQTVPETMVKTPQGKLVKLNDLFAQKPSIVIVYRGGWCPYCNRHLADLRKAEPELKALGYQIIAISPDQPKELLNSTEGEMTGYLLLSDSHANAAKNLGLAYKVDDKTFDRLKDYNIDIEASSGQLHRILPVPAAFIMDKKGTVKFSFVAPDYTVRIHSEVLLAAAKHSL